MTATPAMAAQRKALDRAPATAAPGPPPNIRAAAAAIDAKRAVSPTCKAVAEANSKPAVNRPSRLVRGRPTIRSAIRRGNCCGQGTTESLIASYFAGPIPGTLSSSEIELKPP